MSSPRSSSSSKPYNPERTPNSGHGKHNSSSSSSSKSSSSSSGGNRKHKNSSSKSSRRHDEYKPTAYSEWVPRSVTMYPRIDGAAMLGEGTFGSVYLGKNPYPSLMSTNPARSHQVALKKIRKEQVGFPITAIREIHILQALRGHKNIVELIDVVSSHKNIDDEKTAAEGFVYMVFEFCDHDLTGIMESKELSTRQIKYYLKCLLEACAHCHARMIMHRDIKGANVLVSNNGDVKLADFGLARRMKQAPDRKMKPTYTQRVVTLWYRAPELLLNVSAYDSKIDLWSVGCVFAELLTRGTVLFKQSQDSEMAQLNKIWDVLGTPTEANWPESTALFDKMKIMPNERPSKLVEMFRKANVDITAIDLLSKLLALNPAKRLSAKEALNHKYFTMSPLPMPKEDHPDYTGNFHEYNTKRKKRQREHEASQKAKQVQKPALKVFRGRGGSRMGRGGGRGGRVELVARENSSAFKNSRGRGRGRGR